MEDQYYRVEHTNAGNLDIRMHKHSEGQLLYAEGGIVHIFTQKQHWYLPARCLMWIPAGLEHSVMSKSVRVTYYNFFFPVEQDEDPFYSRINVYAVSDLLYEMILYTRDWEGKIFPENRLEYSFLKTMKLLLSNHKIRLLSFPLEHPFPKSEILQKIAGYMNANLDKDLSVAAVARHYGMSSRTLSRKFRDDLGMNYVRFLRALRITRALELLSEKKYNTYEVAMMVGYNTLSAFSSVFKTVLGISPKIYADMLD